MFGYRGRIGRVYFWLGMMATAAIAGFVTPIAAGIFQISGEPGQFQSVTFIVGLTVWMHSAVTVKRLHDRNRAGWWYALQGFAPPAMFLLAIYLTTVGVPEAASILFVLSFFGILWFVIELGFIPGTRGANRFGPDPTR